MAAARARFAEVCTGGLVAVDAARRDRVFFYARGNEAHCCPKMFVCLVGGGGEAKISQGDRQAGLSEGRGCWMPFIMSGSQQLDVNQELRLMPGKRCHVAVAAGIKESTVAGERKQVSDVRPGDDVLACAPVPGLVPTNQISAGRARDC